MYLVFTRMPGESRGTFGAAYVPCIYAHASESYRRRLGSSLL